MEHKIKQSVLLTLLTNEMLCTEKELIAFFEEAIGMGIQPYHLGNAKQAIKPILRATVSLSNLQTEVTNINLSQANKEQFWLNWHKLPKTWTNQPLTPEIDGPH